ncbi:MAG: glycosyltransferase [Alphaproteobacteria bacterium]
MPDAQTVPRPVLAVVLKGYPRLSETFIAQELLGLERRGIALSIASLRGPREPARHPIHDAIAAPIRYLPEYLRRAPLRVVRAWATVRRLPGYRAARTAFLRDLRRDPTPNRLRRFGQACVLAHELAPEVAGLHAHFLHTPASVARYAALMRGLPLTLSAHAKDIWTTPGWEIAEKLDAADWTAVCSESGRARLASIAPGARLHRLYHGLDLDRFPPFADARPDRRGDRADDPVGLLAVGRAVPKKGYPDLLAALALLPPDLHWRLSVIGDGSDLAGLRAQAQALGLAGRVEWRGAQPQPAVLAALRAADLFVLASREGPQGDRDGLPNVLMEAQSQGLAVAATAFAAIPELVRDGETGLLVPPGDPAALAAALDRLIRDPALRSRLGAAGAARVRAEFDATAGLDALAGLFSWPEPAAAGILPAATAGCDAGSTRCASPSMPR